MRDLTTDELNDIIVACDLVQSWALTRTKSSKDRPWAARIKKLQTEVLYPELFKSMKSVIRDVLASNISIDELNKMTSEEFNNRFEKPKP